MKCQINSKRQDKWKHINISTPVNTEGLSESILLGSGKPQAAEILEFTSENVCKKKKNHTHPQGIEKNYISTWDLYQSVVDLSELFLHRFTFSVCTSYIWLSYIHFLLFVSISICSAICSSICSLLWLSGVRFFFFWSWCYHRVSVCE